ncbi:MAG TPA: MG2 domain-containing protein, partial [Paracoccaceae bacterium]|nr:MG2 domain-containing protein [Paracoccaceae bacterium]
RLLLLAAETDDRAQRALRDRAFGATVNAYLRAASPALRHNILLTMAETLEQTGRGRDMVQALRLAQSLQPRDDTAALLNSASAKYGFRIAGNEVQSDSARPRICVEFSEDLVASGVDYTPYVQLPAPGLTAEVGGPRQLCIEGVTHGTSYTLTFRKGLPAADGQTLAKSVPLTTYVRDRSPGVRFAGRAYVLPKAAGTALPVQTVNTEKLNLTLFRVDDRNLLRSIQNSYFDQSLADYQEDSFAGDVGAQLWSGTATVGMQINRDVTTRLPMDGAIAGLPAGVYALKAAVSGVDPYAVPAAWQWFVISDLGLTTMSGVDGLHVFVRSLGTAEAKAGVSVDLLSRANAVLGSAQTDAMGYARFEAGLVRGTGGAQPALVVVRDDGNDGADDLAFLSLSDPEFDLSDRGVEGREPAPPIDVFLTTDRGAYRAGETVHVTALARDTIAAAIAGLPLTARLKRPDGVEYSRALIADGGAGGYVFALPIAGSAPRGTWRLEILADVDAAPLATKTFLVEDFLPERIDFDLALADGPLRLDDTPEITVAARYLFGAPGADLAIEGEVLLRAASGLAAWPGYVFGRHDTPFESRMEPLNGARTDDAGTAV